jgi:glycosyltransferase involved in cell wall biosynthesis
MSRRSLDHYQRNHPMLAFIERWLHGWTSVLLGNSKAVVGQLEREAGRSDKIGLIHNGVVLSDLPDRTEREKARVTLGLTEPVFVIAIVANVLSYKGYEDLLKALALVASALPNPWKLLAVGRDEGLGEQLRAYAATHGISDHVSWLGERDDVPRILAAADTFVLPSHQEGLSNALIEAMAHGLPVIGTAVGGNLDAIVDGVSGQLVAVQDPKALAAAICDLANDMQRRQRLGAAARLRVERMFSIEACVASYENLYRNLARIGHETVQSIIDGGGPCEG